MKVTLTEGSNRPAHVNIKGIPIHRFARYGNEIVFRYDELTLYEFRLNSGTIKTLIDAEYRNEALPIFEILPLGTTIEITS